MRRGKRHRKGSRYYNKREPNAYEYWTESADDELLESVNSLSVEELAVKFGRSEGAIQSRLSKAMFMVECSGDKGTKNGEVIDYAKIGKEVGVLVKEKQIAYGDSFGRSGDVLRQLYPDGISPDRYDDLLTIARILDKLFRLASEPDAFGENPYKDIVGYGLLGMGRYERDS